MAASACGWAADDGAALVFDDAMMTGAVAWESDSFVYRVERTPDGVTEQRVDARLLYE